jgi:hypothetical protein
MGIKGLARNFELQLREKLHFSHFLIFILFLLALTTNIAISGENQFSILSQQFLKGSLYLPDVVGDAVLFKGKYYWHLGPFPAFALVPFSAITLSIFSSPMSQGVVNFLLVFFSFLLIRDISIKFGFYKDSSLWLSIGVIFSSVFSLSVFLPWSWHFSQTITFFLGLLSLREYMGKKNTFLIGLYHSFILMTRVTAAFGILFYILDIVFSGLNKKLKVRKLFIMAIPLILSGIILLSYNYTRFQDAFDNGYKNSNNWREDSDSFTYEMRHYGLFSVKNIPTNLYYYFFNIPSPVLETVEGYERKLFKADPAMIIHLTFPYIKVSPPGVGFFVVSPIFLLMFRNKLKTKNSKFAAITSLFILIFLLTYYWTGWTQIGPRYMIDLLPFLVILLMESYQNRKVPLGQKILISSSAFFNVFLFFSLFS